LERAKKKKNAKKGKKNEKENKGDWSIRSNLNRRIKRGGKWGGYETQKGAGKEQDQGKNNKGCVRTKGSDQEKKRREEKKGRLSPSPLSFREGVKTWATDQGIRKVGGDKHREKENQVREGRARLQRRIDQSLRVPAIKKKSKGQVARGEKRMKT